MIRTLCTLAAIAIVIASVGNAVVTANVPQVDDTITGSITRGTTPASYGHKFRPDVGGF